MMMWLLGLVLIAAGVFLLVDHCEREKPWW